MRFSIILLAVVLIIPFTAPAQGFSWLRRAGDNNKTNNYGSGVAIDRSHNTIVTGTYAPNCVFGSTTLTGPGSQNIFVAKYDSVGALRWLHTITGDSTNESASVATDISGNSYVVGSTYSPALYFETSDTLHNTSYYNGWNGFVAKYSAAGVMVWARLFKTPYSSKALSVTTDVAGNVIVGGYYVHSLFVGDTALRGGKQNTFIAKFSAAGNLQWANTGKSENTCFIKGLATDPAGNIYATGKLSGDIAYNTQTPGIIKDQPFTGTSIPPGFASSLPNATLLYTPTCLKVSGGVNNTNNYLGWMQYSNLENFRVESDIKVTSSGDGVAVGKYAGAYVLANFPMRTSGTNQVLIYCGSGTMATSATYSIAVGDSVNISIQRNYDTVSATLVNYTQNYTVTTGIRYLIGPPVNNYIIPNNGFYALNFLGGTQDIYNFKLSSTENRNSMCIFIGNSITSGYSSGGLGHRYQDVLYNNHPYRYGTNAGPGDRMIHCLWDTTEVLNLNPRYVFINIGVNDAHGGYDTILFRNDYLQLVQTYKNHGIIPVVGTLTPQGGTLVLPFNRAIRDVAFAEALTVVDIYGALVNPSTGSMYPVYDIGDNVHPNPAGNIRMAAAIATDAPFLLSDTTMWEAGHMVTKLPSGKDKVFVSKFDQLGVLQWIIVDTSITDNATSVYDNYTCGNGIALDNTGNIYVGGNLLDAIYTISGVPTPVHSAFLKKYNNTGTPLWSKRWGSDQFNSVRGVATGNTGSPYIVGNYSGLLTIGTTTLPPADFTDVFIAKFDNAGNRIWVTNSLGHANLGNAIAVDVNDSSIATTGNYNNSVVFGTLSAGTSITPSAYNYNIFVAKQKQNLPLVTTSVNNTHSYTVYPNPANSNINISFDQAGTYKVAVTDISGRTLHSTSTDRSLLTIDISQYASGMYYITITGANDPTATYKFVKM